MKGTRLWQRTHSPLIEGRSRRERSLALEWALSTFVAIFGLLIVAVLVIARGAEPNAAGYVSAAATVVVPVAAGSAVGALAGVWLARAMGWRPGWVTGLVMAVALGASVWGLYGALAGA